MTLEKSPRVLIVDDDPYVGEMLKDFLSAADLQTTWIDVAEQAFAEAEKGVHDVLLLDVMMPGMDGLTFLRKIKEVQPSVEVIMLTARQEMALLDRALKLKAFDYLVKPASLQKLVATIRAAMTCRLQKMGAPASPVPLGSVDQGWLVAGPETARLHAWARACAPYCATALITGPKGAGAKHLSRVLHSATGRPANKLVHVNLIELDAAQQEPELMGGLMHWKRTPVAVGALKRADGGTLVLENIERLSNSLQRRLITLLDTGQLDDPPSMDEDFLDVKIVALTHEDLAARARTEGFSPDLLRKLSLVQTAIAPLSSRRTEIVPLARQFLKEVRPDATFAPEAEHVLAAAAWPGEISELRAVVARSAKKAQNPVVELGDLPEGLRF